MFHFPQSRTRDPGWPEYSLGFSGRVSEEDWLFLLFWEGMSQDEDGYHMKRVCQYNEERSRVEEGREKQQNSVVLKVA